MEQVMVKKSEANVNKTLQLVLGVSVIVSAIVYLLLLPRYQYWELFVAKPLPIVLMIFFVGVSSKSKYARLVQVALAFSVVGDVFLINKDKTSFLLGLGSFLIAHIAFIVAYLSIQKKLHLSRVIPFAIWVGAMYYTLFPTLKGMKIPVALYALAIMLMMWRAAAQIGMEKGPAPWLVSIGAMSFAFSDSVIALNRFHKPISGAVWYIVITYLVGQALMSLSVIRADSSQESTS